MTQDRPPARGGLGGRREVWYGTEREDDPDRVALTAEWKAEERVEKEAPCRRNSASSGTTSRARGLGPGAPVPDLQS